MHFADAGRRKFDLATAACSALIFAFYPLTSSDLWWHLASGREIWRRRGIPATDPFSFASDRGLWLDHGWLFQTIVYPLHAAGGALLLQLLQVLLVFAIALLILRQLGRDSVPKEAALLTMAVSMATAKPRLTLRPELITLLLLVVLLTWLRRTEDDRKWPVASLACLAVVWMNLHPGAVLGALVLLIWCAFESVRAFLGKAGARQALKPGLALTAFALALMVTPYGVDSLLFPFRLQALVSSDAFINPEWQAATFARLPLLYVTLAAALLLVVVASRGRLEGTRLPRVLILTLLGYLALRYQRNAGVFAVSVPILIGPELAALSRSWSERRPRLLLAAAAVAALYSLLTFEPPGLGINRSQIAADATDFVKQTGIRGRMFNQAGFGGYLIWALYPDQRVLMDGRNEVYTELLPRLAGVIGDDRQWRSFLRDEQIEWAIIGYNNPGQRVIEMGRQGEVHTGVLPFGYTHFPPKEWALVYWDDVAMVMIRRGGLNAHLERDAPRYLWPEDTAFANRMIRSGAWPRAVVAAELGAAIQRRPDVERAYALADVVRAPRE